MLLKMRKENVLILQPIWAIGGFVIRDSELSSRGVLQFVFFSLLIWGTANSDQTGKNYTLYTDISMASWSETHNSDQTGKTTPNTYRLTSIQSEHLSDQSKLACVLLYFEFWQKVQS